MRGFWRALIILLIGLAFISKAEAINEPIKVGVMTDEPGISFQNPNGELIGIGVDIWREIASRQQWQYRFIPIKGSIAQAIEAAKQGQFDVVIGPISVTNERLKIVDFSRPYFLARISVAVRDQPKTFWSVIGTFYTTPIILTVLVFLGLFIIFTHLYWLFERGRTDNVDSSYRIGIFHAMWHTVTAFLRDVIYDPMSVGTRITLALWLVCSVTFMALFAALVTSSLTLVLFKQQEAIHKPQDLFGKTVAVEEGTEEIRLLKNLGAKVVTVPHPSKALHNLAAGQYDAVVGPFTILDHEIQKHASLNLHITPLILANETFAFLVPQNEPLRRAIDLALTEIQDQNMAHNICERHMTRYHHSCDF